MTSERIMKQFRWATPILVTIAIFLLGLILTKVGDIDSKLFVHLTNAEMHTPRSFFSNYMPRPELEARFRYFEDFVFQVRQLNGKLEQLLK